MDEMYIGSMTSNDRREDYLSNWNLKSFDNLYASLAESAYRDRPKNFPYEQLDQIQEERSKLKWEYDNEIDAFYKNQKKLESKDKKNQ